MRTDAKVYDIKVVPNDFMEISAPENLESYFAREANYHLPRKSEIISVSTSISILFCAVRCVHFFA